MDDLTEAFLRSLGRMHAEQAADDLTALAARNIGAVFAAQAKAERSRALHARLEANLAQMGAHRAAMERKYGPMDVLKERMMARPGMRSQIMMRASYHEWPADR